MAFAAPVEKDGFSYAGDSLYCQSSNLNRHRRATVPELKAHFSGKDKEDRPAHWYEAQLIHYGLPPSKVKGTAHKRLFDAVNKKGGLSVPANITKIENDLKKMWTKREREAKKVLKESTAAATASTPAKGTKRKAPQAATSTATVTYNTSYIIHNSGSLSIQNAEHTAKKAKTTKPASAKAATPNKTNAAPKGPKTATTTKATKASTAPKSSTKAASQRAGPSRSAPAAASSSQSANRGYDEPPPPYEEFNRNDTPAFSGYGATSSQQLSPGPRPKLGLLNGRYEVSCPDLEDDYPEYRDRMSLIVTMDNQKLWVKFDLGVVEGMMSLSRPWEATPDPHLVCWRGHSEESYRGQYRFEVDEGDFARGDNHLVFLGGGHIRGSITLDGDGEILFDAYRLPGQGTTSEVSRAQARDEWDHLSRDFW